MRVLAFALLLACGASPKASDMLIESSTAYQEGVRWGRYEDAALHLPAEQRDHFLDERDRLGKDLRIDDYEVVRVHLQNGQKAARVRVKYTWHLDSVGKVHETVTEQNWTRRERHWLLESEFVKRGEPLPGIPVAPADADGDTNPPDDGER
jgi:hypothetical protein